MVKGRWFDWALALAAGALAAAMVLVPAGPNPEDLDLEVVSVRELTPKENEPRQVEIKVRWHWRKPVRLSRSDMVAISPAGNWWVMEGNAEADSWVLSVLGKPRTLPGYRVDTQSEGEAKFLIFPWNDTPGNKATAIKLQAHYIHKAPSRLRTWPGQSWVKSVGGTYPLNQYEDVLDS